MKSKTKSVAEMTVDEYYQYLISLSDEDFMRIFAHDVKKVSSVVHGYLSLIRLDVSEDVLDPVRLSEYVDMMEAMLQKSYMYVDAARAAYQTRFLSDKV
jgi:hypothetical protein